MDLGMSSVDIDMGQMWSSSGKQLHLYPSSYDVFPDDTDLQTEFPISKTGLQCERRDSTKPLVDFQRDSWDDASPKTKMACTICFALVVATASMLSLIAILTSRDEVSTLKNAKLCKIGVECVDFM
ncbi:uncharacterized protein LOC142353384 [Convolutriloba macropyga]|uniref:uncharacterized protein LOC142353384 n=1 Tax=Convolutriloba macropyga TaxID=536237 RepID=UPI003F524330